MHACMCECMQACMCDRMHACMCEHMHACMCECVKCSIFIVRCRHTQGWRALRLCLIHGGHAHMCVTDSSTCPRYLLHMHFQIPHYVNSHQRTSALACILDGIRTHLTYIHTYIHTYSGTLPHFVSAHQPTNASVTAIPVSDTPISGMFHAYVVLWRFDQSQTHRAQRRHCTGMWQHCGSCGSVLGCSKIVLKNGRVEHQHTFMQQYIHRCCSMRFLRVHVLLKSYASRLDIYTRLFCIFTQTGATLRSVRGHGCHSRAAPQDVFQLPWHKTWHPNHSDAR